MGRSIAVLTLFALLAPAEAFHVAPVARVHTPTAIARRTTQPEAVIF